MSLILHAEIKGHRITCRRRRWAAREGRLSDLGPPYDAAVTGARSEARHLKRSPPSKTPGGSWPLGLWREVNLWRLPARPRMLWNSQAILSNAGVVQCIISQRFSGIRAGSVTRSRSGPFTFKANPARWGAGEALTSEFPMQYGCPRSALASRDMRCRVQARREMRRWSKRR